MSELITAEDGALTSMKFHLDKSRIEVHLDRVEDIVEELVKALEEA